MSLSKPQDHCVLKWNFPNHFKYTCTLCHSCLMYDRYVPPLRPVTSRWSLELPDSPSAIEEELHKQESLLTQLHEDLMRVEDTQKEDHLWEVQRVVTQLKRKVNIHSYLK